MQYAKHISTDFRVMICDHCCQRIEIPNRLPLLMVEDFMKSFNKLHKNCKEGDNQPLLVEMELVKG